MHGFSASLKVFLGMVLLLGASNLPAQIISSIRHEPFQGKVLITYSINGLAPDQRMAVSLYCSDDKFKNELKSVTGNGVGENVYGNSEKTVLWDVLKDRTQLVGNISFEIRALVFNDHINATNTSASRDTITTTLEDKKNSTHAQIASALGNFIVRANDLVTLFRGMNEKSIEDYLALRKMTEGVIQYNEAFNTLNNNRMGYEKQVLVYWKNEALYNDVRYLFDYALGELHAVNVLELNDALYTINDLNTGKISGKKNEREAKEKVLANIVQNTNQLDKRIEELERRANRILYTLSGR
jgi:hypothetical protein